MTVSSTSARQTYIGDGSTALYSYNFRILSAADLVLVKRNTATGTETKLVYGVDYTVTGAGGYSGGTFTLTAGVLPPGFALAAYRVVDLLQSTDLRNQGKYLAEVHELVFDRLMMINQQLQDQLNRAVRLPDSEAGGELLKLPAKELRALQGLAFDANGNPIAAGAASAPVSTAVQPVVAAADLAAARAAAGGLIPSVATVAAMKALSGTNLTGYVQVAGYFTAGDGGGGLFRWVVADATADNGGTVITPTAGGGRFRRIHDGMVSVKWFGAVGDGVTNDTAAIQAAINSGARRIYFPAGTYLVTTVRLPHSTVYYSPDTGLEIFGDGPWTVITRGETLASHVVNYASEPVYEAQCALAVHSSHHRIHDLSFEDCANAIYFGQYPSAVGDSHCSFNRLKNLLIRNCGTGMHWAVAQGCYYNEIEDIHVTQCQIGIHLRAGSRWPSSTANNNRNLWKNVRTSRCYVGFWLKNGDTNGMVGVHAEGCDGVPTGNRYSLPTSILPAAITAPIGHIFDDQAHNNNCFGNVMESCDFTLYNAGNFNSFRDCLYRESETAPVRVLFVTAPSHLSSRDSFYSKGFGYLSNQIAGAFAGFPAGEWVIPNALRLKALQRQEQGVSVAINRMVDLGALASSAAVVATLQADSSSDTSLVTSSGILECVVVGNCTASSLAHSKEFRVLWQRNGSRTLTRYYLFGEVAARATGANAGDATEPFTLALSVSGKDLQVTVTAPARAFAGVSLHIRDRRNY